MWLKPGFSMKSSKTTYDAGDIIFDFDIVFNFLLKNLTRIRNIDVLPTGDVRKQLQQNHSDVAVWMMVRVGNF